MDKSVREFTAIINDVYLNKKCEIFVYNRDKNTFIDDDCYIQTELICPECGWKGVERIIGEAYVQKKEPVSGNKDVELLREMYIALCPECNKHFPADLSRIIGIETEALDINEDDAKLTELIKNANQLERGIV